MYCSAQPCLLWVCAVTPCALGGCATVSKISQDRFLGCRPGWAWKWRYKRPLGTLLAHAATWPLALDPSHVTPKRGCWLLAGACWCLLVLPGELTFQPT